MSYDRLKAHIDKKGLKVKAESNLSKVEATKAEYKNKEKLKALTTAERLDRIEKLLGL